MDELKPCPFCGQTDLVTWHDPKTTLHPWFRIECDNCGCHGPGTDQGTHRAQWNRRSTDTTPVIAQPQPVRRDDPAR